MTPAKVKNAKCKVQSAKPARARAAGQNAVTKKDVDALFDKARQHAGPLDKAHAAAEKALEALKPFDFGKAELRLVAPKDIVPSPDNVRHFDPKKDPDDAQFLAEIKAQGVLVPLHVRTHPKLKGKYDLRAGERRHAAAPWDLADATLDKAAGACVVCPKRSKLQGLLFADNDEEITDAKDRCLDPVCWQRKAAAALPAKIAAERAKNPKLLLIDDQGGPVDKSVTEEFGPVLSSGQYSDVHEWNKSKAVKALVVRGPHAGEVRDVVTYASERSGGSSSGRRVAGEKVSLADRRKLLDKKRWHEVLKLLRAELAKVDMAKLPVPAGTENVHYHVLTLAAMFGTAHRNDAPGAFMPGHEYNRRKATDPWKLLEEWKKSKLAVATMNLWASVRAVLAKRITLLPSFPITQTPDDCIADAKQIAALCAIDLESLRAKAADIYKEPRAWKSLAGYTPEKVNPSHPTEPLDAGLASIYAEHKDGRRVVVRIVKTGLEAATGKADGYALFTAQTSKKEPLGKRVAKKEHPSRATLGEAEKDLRDYASANGFKIVSTPSTSSTKSTKAGAA
jgi:hypothetical protein